MKDINGVLQGSFGPLFDFVGIVEKFDFSVFCVRTISAKTASAVAVEHHYLHRKMNVRFAFGLYQNGVLIGIVSFGIPASRHLQLSACPSAPDRVIELNRLWITDGTPRNTESYFISRALKMLPPFIVVSYADTMRQHYGYVYRACNFFYAGWTDMERKTPRFDYIVPGKHTRDAFRGLDGAQYTAKVRRMPKVKYWTVSGNRRDRKQLQRLSGWPKLSWETLPPPRMAETSITAAA